MEQNLLLIHGGGPTAVINASLYGVLAEAQMHREITHVYAARNGTGGLLAGDLLDLTGVPEAVREKLLHTPGSAIGTSRDQLEEADYRTMAGILRDRHIRWVLMNGGNGTMDTCGRLCRACAAEDAGISVMGIPKTMDNDIAVTDHSPGFPSAARYLAESIREVSADVRSLPIHVVVVEALGRNAGWVTAAASLAGEQGNPGADLIYLPEKPFCEEKFLAQISDLLEIKKGIVVVASEGLKKEDGSPLVAPIFQTGRATYFGDVSAHLAHLVVQKLGCKARSEKPGLLGRASIRYASSVDRAEAVLAGREALKAALNGESGRMVAFRRLSGTPYRMEPFLTDIREVMLHEKTLPAEFINTDGSVAEAYREWLRPLLGEPLPDMAAFN